MFLKKTVVLGLCLMCSLAAKPHLPGITGEEQPRHPDSVRNVKVGEVTIMASRMGNQLQNLPQKVEVIQESLINSLPSENLSELLKRASNIDILQNPGLSGKVGMRGFSPSASTRSYTLILINGKPSATVNLSSISMDNVERVEVVKGPYSVLYGSDAMAGVINIITKQGADTPEAAVSVESGSFGSLKLSAQFAGNLNDKLTFRLGYSRMEQDKNYRIGNHNLLKISQVEKLILDKGSYGDRMDNSKYELNQLNGFMGLHINGLWQVNVEGIYTFAFDVGIPGSYWGVYGQNAKDIDRVNLSLNLKRNSRNNHFSFSPYFSRELSPSWSGTTDDAFLDFKSNVKEYGLQLQDAQTFGGLSVLAGFDYHVYDYRSERWESAGTPTSPYNPDNNNTNMAVFTQLAWSDDFLNLNAGVRYDHYKYAIEENEYLGSSRADETYGTVNPSAGAQVRVLKNVKAHSSFGTAFSIPDAYKVAGSYAIGGEYKSNYVGNPDLKPEKSRTFDAGLGYASGNNVLKADVTYFHTVHYRKIVDYQLDSGDNSYRNANKANMDGIELMSSFDLGGLLRNSFKLELYSNWTWMLRTELEEEGQTETMVRDMRYVRKSNGSFGIVYGPKSWLSMRLHGRYIGSRLEQDFFGKTPYSESLRPGITSEGYFTGGGYTAPDAILKHADYLLFDYSIKYSYNKHLDFGIMVSNVMNENYSEVDGYNMPGRSISAKITYAF